MPKSWMPAPCGSDWGNDIPPWWTPIPRTSRSQLFFTCASCLSLWSRWARPPSSLLWICCLVALLEKSMRFAPANSRATLSHILLSKQNPMVGSSSRNFSSESNRSKSSTRRDNGSLDEFGGFGAASGTPWLISQMLTRSWASLSTLLSAALTSMTPPSMSTCADNPDMRRFTFWPFFPMRRGASSGGHRHASSCRMAALCLTASFKFRRWKRFFGGRMILKKDRLLPK